MPASKTQQVAQATAKASQLEAKPNTVKADRRPPDPDPGPEAGPGLVLSKVTTTSQVYELPNTPRPSSSQLYLFRHGFSPNRSLSTQSGPTPAGSNNPGHGNDSNLPICPPPSVRAPVRGGLLGGQPRGQLVRVQHLPDHTSIPPFTQSSGAIIFRSHLSDLQYASRDYLGKGVEKGTSEVTSSELNYILDLEDIYSYSFFRIVVS